MAEKLVQLYKVQLSEAGIQQNELNELLNRVDIIPVSLALSQAAAETGWGTSDFAEEGNALYGQWSWGKNAMKPDQQREHLGNYGVAAFESLQESVSAYMLNLNTHNAYSILRELRAEQRVKNESISGHYLAAGLIRYSEEGESYIKTLRTIIEYNKLEKVDETYLADGDAIYLYRSTN